MNKLRPIETEQSAKSETDYVAERLVRLVSVGLKEATMDSPSFRASMNYMHILILQCSHHMEGSIGVMQNYVQNWNNFIRVSHDVGSLFDPYISDPQFISNDVSKPCVQEFLKGQRIIFDSSLSLLKVDEFSIQTVTQLLDYDFPQYMELRRNFEKIQNKYDIVSAKFMQLPKGYDASKTREDALQLFEIRKQYIHFSMILWIHMKQLESKISKTVTDLSDSFWNSFQLNSNGMSNAAYATKLSDALGLTAIVDSIHELSQCARLQHNSTKLLVNDLNRARENSEEGAVKMYTPSTNISDYDPSILDESKLIFKDDPILEKHGWVFIKSPKLMGKGDVWIKRWMFVKNGVFGFLAISQDGQYVQESDKIGVLSVQVRYLPSEDRKFCLRITSEHTNLIIQVETLAELRSWLTVFRNVTTEAASSDKTKEVASIRYPPALNILKLVPVVAKDLELVDVIKQDPQREKTSQLIEMQLSNLKFNLSINPPLRTSMTEKLSMAHIYLSSTTIPSALTANFWGYVNWGLYFVLDEESKQILAQETKHLGPQMLVQLRYPDFYPDHLRLADAELRSIFEVCIKDDEFTLLKFNASWSPNSEQKLFCTIYLTNYCFYVYSHTCGLISIVPIKLTNFLNTEVIKRKGSSNTIKVYFVSGMSLKMQVYLQNIYDVEAKFNFILSSMKKDKLRDLKNVIQELAFIEQSSAKIRDARKNNLMNGVNNPNTTNQPNDEATQTRKQDVSLLTGVNSTTSYMDKTIGISNFYSDMQVNYTPDMHLLLIKKVKMPAKALFHLLFGDESFLLQCTLPLASSIFKDDHLKHSLWRCDSKQKMSRVVWNAIFKVPCALQTIEKLDNNKYYNVVQETPYLRFVFGINRKIIMRFVIHSVDSKSCKLLIYYTLGDEAHNVMNWFTRKITHQIMMFRMEALEEKLDVGIKQLKNENRKIAAAIQTFGPITKYDSDEMTKEEGLFEKSVNFIPLQLFSTFYYEKINFEFERLATRMCKRILHIVGTIVNFFSTNMVLVFIFSFSIVLNLLLVGRSSSAYWRERNANKHVESLMGNHFHMQRSLSVNEIDELIYPNHTDLSYSSTGSECYWRFLKSEDLLSMNELLRKTDTTLDKLTGSVDVLRGNIEISLSKKLTGLRIERNEVLTRLNLLNYLEREYILKEWKEWITSELANCERVKKLYNSTYPTIEGYCEDVEHEMSNLYETLL